MPMFDTAFVLLVITALLAVVGLCQPFAAYLKLPLPSFSVLSASHWAASRC